MEKQILPSSCCLKSFLKALPKCQLHLHIEGTFQPELIFKMSERNGISLPYPSVDALRQAYSFTSLQSFLDVYYLGSSVLIKEEDFFELAMAYLEKCYQDNVAHTEIFVDPQSHTSRGVQMGTIINGIFRAMQKARQQWGISSGLIVCFLRHLNQESALKTYEQAKEFKQKIIGFGLDSSEVGNLPEKFVRVYEKARNDGFRIVAHACEQGDPQYAWQALNLLRVQRIDHGIRCIEDPALIEYLVTHKIPLTVCPLSNLKLELVKRLEDHPFLIMLNKGLIVSINSDDPAYFGGYVNENYYQTAMALSMTKRDLIKVARNSFVSSFLDETEKNKWIKVLDDMEATFEKGICAEESKKE